MLTIDNLADICRPHNERVIAEGAIEDARHALEQIMGHLGAARVQRAAGDDRIIAEHIDAAYDIARAAMRAAGAQTSADRIGSK